jgi:FixJ family two-component response regulator
MAAQSTVVIVVDDNAGFLKGVARLLAHNGIKSRTFASAEALLESGSAQTATCLLLDIQDRQYPLVTLRRSDADLEQALFKPIATIGDVASLE